MLKMDSVKKVQKIFSHPTIPIKAYQIFMRLSLLFFISHQLNEILLNRRIIAYKNVPFFMIGNLVKPYLALLNNAWILKTELKLKIQIIYFKIYLEAWSIPMICYI
jgi:hypothetical protein